MSLFRVLRAGALALTLTLVPGAAQAESLRQALEFAYLNNPAIMSALLSIKMSAEDVALRKSGKLPTIALNGSFTGAFSAPGGGSVELSRSHRLSLSYQQTLFDNFKTESEIEQARAFVELSKFALRSAEQNVLLAVATAYMSVVRDTQLVAMRQENVSFFQAQLESADSRLRLGEGTQIDVSQSTTRLAAATAFYRAAIANLQISQASYERWVGHKPRNLTSGFNFNGSLPRSVDAALALSESNHPAILTARAAIRATQAGSDAARAAFGPTLSLIGSLCGAGCFAVDPDQGGFTGSVTLQLTVPIYAGGALGASVRKANLGQIQSEVDALATRDQVRESVISAWASLQNAIAQIESAQSAVESARLVVDGTIQERDVGAKTTLDVLNAQSELTAAREQLISASASQIIASFALLAASGQLSVGGLDLRVEMHSADGYIATVEDVWQELRALPEN